MKKTLTVNLGGTVYHIDEDAYVLLDNYLNNLRYHFRKEAGADEIVRDMETRISELFNEYIREGIQVITIEQVEAVIARMGKPEELSADEEDEKTEQKAEEPAQRAVKRLFRNPDDRILGGVLSGLAAYFGWDTTPLRILLLVAGFILLSFGGFFPLILAYIILWIIVPQARTATEKLQMRGEPINMENIGKTVTDGFERESEKGRSAAPRSLLARFFDGLVQVAGFIIKFVLVLLAICCIPALLVGLVVAFALLMAATGILASAPAVLYYALPEIDWSLLGTAPVSVIGLSVCVLLVVGIPIWGFLQLLLQSFNVWRPMSTGVKITLILLWILAVAVGTFFLFQLPFLIDSMYWA